MSFETAFSIAGLIAMIGWVLLLLSPWLPDWSTRLAGIWLPVLLSSGYVALLLLPTDGGGGYSTLADVRELFSHDQALLAGWVHFLAFDLLIGALVCRTGREAGLRFVFVAPCLPVVFLFGPAGYLMFQVVLVLHRRRQWDPGFA